MATYYPAIGQDKNNNAYNNAPPPTSLVASRHSENATASSVITLTHDTTLVEIAATGGPVAMRWVRTSDTQASVVTAAGSANFTHIVPASAVRQFLVPKETIGSSQNGSIQGVNRAEGLFQRIAYKSAAGVSSVLMSEFTPGAY